MGVPYDCGMRVIVNGTERDVAEGMTVKGLITASGLEGRACAVEVNKRLVPHREHETRVLAAEDRVELVSLVGGG